MKGTTKSGFKFNIDDRIVGDWRLVEAIAKAESDDPGQQLKGTMEVADLLLGKDKESLMKFLQEKNDGYIPSIEVTNTIAEIMTTVREIKNSQSSAG